MNFKEWLKRKTFGIQGLVSTQENPNNPRNTFVNSFVDIQNTKLKEYNVWYGGDSDELLNFYFRNNMINYNYEPYYDRNKQSYFWAISSTEDDIKRTHSGQPRNIVDTMVNIVGVPNIDVSSENSEEVNKVLKKILKDNHFKKMFLQEQLPLTLVEGWGAWKINWDTSLRDTPILLYYRADAVEFIYRSNQVVAIAFKDYYFDEKGNKYLLIETRRTEMTEEEGKRVPSLIIEKELFILGEDDVLLPKPLTDLPQLKDVAPLVKISNYRGFLAVPCVIYVDNETENTGRSIFTGKIDLFDDLDQCLSQSSNTVRRSTAREYFNSNYLERDPETGLPIQPSAYDRKYTLYAGGRDANGGMTGEPVQVTQPAVNFVQYDSEAQHILIEIISGIMSPATLGIDLAKNQPAEAQREKEKVTIFTRNTIIDEEVDILEKLTNELLIANELMHKGEITVIDYDVCVKFDEFADSSYESKLEVLLTAFNGGIITPELFIDKLYGDSLSEVEKKKQVDYIVQQQQAAQGGGMSPEMLGAMGAQMGGMNPYDAALMSPEAILAAQSGTGEIPAAMEGKTRETTGTRDGRSM